MIFHPDNQATRETFLALSAWSHDHPDATPDQHQAEAQKLLAEMRAKYPEPDKPVEHREKHG